MLCVARLGFFFSLMFCQKTMSKYLFRTLKIITDKYAFPIYLFIYWLQKFFVLFLNLLHCFNNFVFWLDHV